MDNDIDYSGDEDTSGTKEEQPLTPREAESMGRQTETHTIGQKISNQVVYGDTESVENEDQMDEHHGESDDIVEH
jgi:hypothetical protein